MTVAVLLVALVALAVAGVLALALRRARTAERGARAEAARAVEEEGRATRRRSRLLATLHFATLRVDGDARLIEANAAALERFPFLVPGMGVLEAFSEHLFAGRVTTALDDMAPSRFEIRLFADGRRTYLVAVDPYEIGDDREALILLTDASEAADYQELRSQFVANVSHELRTPLTGLRALLEALDDPSMDPVVHRDFVGRASRETARLEALIADILLLSELEATQGAPSGTRSDLVTAALEAAEELEGLAREQRVGLVLQAEGEAWTPLTERMARTVVRNLVENAIKYAGNGATTTTSVEIVDGWVVLRVADDGAGIPERHLPHVFERFYRADPSRSKRMGGTGLGMSIVKHIAERFGGRVEAESREGFGTTVTVTVPQAGAADGA